MLTRGNTGQDYTCVVCVARHDKEAATGPSGAADTAGAGRTYKDSDLVDPIAAVQRDSTI